MKVRAAILWEQGHEPDDEGPLVVEEVDLDGPGPGELLVRITAAGLCHSDLSAITGDRPRTMPAVIGHEAAGVVEDIGPDVDGLAVGDQLVMVFVRELRPVRLLCRRPAQPVSVVVVGSHSRDASDGKPVSSIGGRPLHHYSGISAFAERAVVVPSSVVRIDPDVPPEVAAIFGCAVITGVGAVVNTARVPAGASVAVAG